MLLLLNHIHLKPGYMVYVSQFTTNIKICY